MLEWGRWSGFAQLIKEILASRLRQTLHLAALSSDGSNRRIVSMATVTQQRSGFTADDIKPVNLDLVKADHDAWLRITSETMQSFMPEYEKRFRERYTGRLDGSVALPSASRGDIHSRLEQMFAAMLPRREQAAGAAHEFADVIAGEAFNDMAAAATGKAVKGDRYSNILKRAVARTNELSAGKDINKNALGEQASKAVNWNALAKAVAEVAGSEMYTLYTDSEKHDCRFPWTGGCVFQVLAELAKYQPAESIIFVTPFTASILVGDFDGSYTTSATHSDTLLFQVSMFCRQLAAAAMNVKVTAWAERRTIQPQQVSSEAVRYALDKLPPSKMLRYVLKETGAERADIISRDIAEGRVSPQEMKSHYLQVWRQGRNHR